MTSRERLMATLRGEKPDRIPVNFYEIGGQKVDPTDSDPFNIYNDPSWLPLLELAQQTDLIVMASAKLRPASDNCHDQFFKTTQTIQNGSRYIHTELKIGSRILTETIRRDPEVDTFWKIEHLLKDVEDLKAFLTLPDEVFAILPSVENLVAEEEAIGERGIVMVDTSDPLCQAADLFSMQDYLLVAFQEQSLFHQLLEKIAQPLYPIVSYVAQNFPGHLWRVYGPEYATPPYLPPRLFGEYVGRYTQPIVAMIQQYGGFARVHCHGCIREVLPQIVAMGAVAIDPIEPPPQGDVELAEVREKYGNELVLFGNIEVSDLENLEPSEFQKVVKKTYREGTTGAGRGFVLMPTACPYGRTITAQTLANYQAMLRMVNHEFA
jgi:uroporphyrinogen-III decarboxylase